MSAVFAANGAEPSFLTVLVPSKRGNGSCAYPGKQFHLKPDGSVRKDGYRIGRQFDAYDTSVSTLTGLNDTLRSIASKRLGFAVPGRLRNAEETRAIRRLSRDRKDVKATLESVPLRWMLFDLDKVPNRLGLDPRLEPDATRSWLLSLLPRAVQQADAVVRWSSSLCVGVNGPPETLSAHIWVWLSEPLDAAEAKALLIRADAQARAALDTARGGAGGKQVIDWKVTEAQQPIYVAPPLLLDGIADPFNAEERQVIVQGAERVVDITTLRNELASVAVPAPSATRPKRAKARDGSKPVSAPPPTRVRPLLALPNTRELGRDHFLVRQIAGHAREGADEQHTKRSADRARGLGRMAAELIRVALARVEWGRTHTEFAAWSAAGGVPDGERDLWLYSISACLAHALSTSAIKEGRLHRLVCSIGNALCSEEWMAGEWLKGGYGRSVLEKAGAAARGETSTWEGKQVDARYQVSAANICRDLGICDDELRALRLLSLADGAALKANRRALAADPTQPSRKRHLTAEESAAEKVAVANLRSAGKSLRAIVAETGIPIANVQRWAARTVGGDPICPTDLESSRREEGDSTSTTSVHAAVTESNDVQTAAVAASGVTVADGLARLGIAVPSFIIRSKAERVKAAFEKSERFVAKSARLVAALAKRGSAPLDELPCTPSLDHLDTNTQAAVLAAQNALHAAQRRVVIKVETSNRRWAATAEREAFWGPLEQDIGKPDADPCSKAERRLEQVTASWGARVARAEAEWKRSGSDEALRRVVNLGRARRAVLKAEQRYFEDFKRKLAA